MNAFLVKFRTSQKNTHIKRTRTGFEIQQNIPPSIHGFEARKREKYSEESKSRPGGVYIPSSPKSRPWRGTSIASALEFGNGDPVKKK
jgi:hypothetical protein